VKANHSRHNLAKVYSFFNFFVGVNYRGGENLSFFYFYWLNFKQFFSAFCAEYKPGIKHNYILQYGICRIILCHCESGAQPGFCYGRDLKMENFSDVILMTYFRWRNLYDAIKCWCHVLLFQVLLCHSQFLIKNLAKSRNLRSLKHKKDQTYPLFYLYS